jgi:hypothetical protein
MRTDEPSQAEDDRLGAAASAGSPAESLPNGAGVVNASESQSEACGTARVSAQEGSNALLATGAPREGSSSNADARAAGGSTFALTQGKQAGSSIPHDEADTLHGIVDRAGLGANEDADPVEGAGPVGDAARRVGGGSKSAKSHGGNRLGRKGVTGVVGGDSPSVDRWSSDEEFGDGARKVGEGRIARTKDPGPQESNRDTAVSKRKNVVRPPPEAPLECAATNRMSLTQMMDAHLGAAVRVSPTASTG